MITWIEFIIALPVIILSGLLVGELLLGTLLFNTFSESRYATSTARKASEYKPTTAILIPAHNEEDVIKNTLVHLQASLGQQDTIVVVADNCTDSTRQICEAEGVVVLERFNTLQKGKGFALEYGRQWILQHLDVEVVVVFDADCQFVGNSFKRLVQTAHAQQRVCQSCYLMKAKFGAAKTLVSEFTWWLKNAIRPTGHKALGIGTQIQGSGIAFPTDIIGQINLASGSIVEDLELGLNLSMRGFNVQFCEQSLVESAFPENAKGLEAQRTRWEHGHLATLGKIPALLVKALANFDLKSAGLLLDAAIPPLFSFLLLQTTTCLLGVLLYLMSGNTLLMSVTFVALTVTCLSLLLVWAIHGRKILGLSSIKFVLAFFLAKFSIYGRFFTQKQSSWEKTTRDKE